MRGLMSEFPVPQQESGFTGIIGETVREQSDALRSCHPTHSWVGFGAGAEFLLSGHGRSATPCGHDSPFFRLMQRDGIVLLLGVGAGSLTNLHAVEDARNVQYLSAIEPLRRHATYTTSGRRIQYKYGDLLQDACVTAGILRTRRIGAANCHLLRARDLGSFLWVVTEDDPWCLVLRPSRGAYDPEADAKLKTTRMVKVWNANRDLSAWERLLEASRRPRQPVPFAPTAEPRTGCPAYRDACATSIGVPPTTFLLGRNSRTIHRTNPVWQLATSAIGLPQPLSQINFMNSNTLKAAIVGFDITPRFHSVCGAWGCTPTMTEVDLPLLSRCVALEEGGRRLIWYGSDLVGETIKGTDTYRDEVADALKLRRDQVIWSTSQTHSSGAVPGSSLTGSSVCDLSKNDPAFMAAERKRLMKSFIDAGRRALAEVQPARVWAGRGFCDSMSYNTRMPMPSGGVKFSRHHQEGLESGKFFDPTIGLVRFESPDGKPLGAIFNFCSHPATMINDKMISPDWVGTARAHIEDALGGAPAMFAQGFCGDVNCHHIFGTTEQAKRSGARLGRAAVEALSTLTPVRGNPC